MTLTIEDVKVGDWLTRRYEGSVPDCLGEDVLISAIEPNGLKGFVELLGVEGTWNISRFTSRPFRVGDVVECVDAIAGIAWIGDRHIVESVTETGGRQYLALTGVCGGAVTASYFRLITPAHLVRPTQWPAQPADPPCDDVIHPAHSSAGDCIEFIEQFSYNCGSAIGLIYGVENGLDDIGALRVAIDHLEREIERIKKMQPKLKGGAK